MIHKKMQHLLIIPIRWQKHGLISIGESGLRLIVIGSKVMTSDYAVMAGHSSIVLYASFLWRPISSKNFFNRIQEPVVNVKPKCPQTVTTLGTQTQ